MSEMRYTADHLWARRETDGTMTVGLSGFAQEQLGDIVFVGLPEVGSEHSKNDAVAVIEFAKVAVDLRMPASGRIVAVNQALAELPATVNSDPTGTGWLYRIQPIAPSEYDELLDYIAYDRLIER